MVPENRTRTEQFTVSVPTWREENRPYTVMMPYTETRQATRQVCEMVPTTETRTICQDRGHWQTQVVAARPIGDPCDPCGQACAPACATTRVWVPNLVQEQIPITVMRPQWKDVPYEYQVTLFRPETRQQTVRLCEFRNETRSREVNFVEFVPQKRTTTENVITCRWVPEQREEQYTVMVPRQSQREIQVQVCRMVPETITTQQPTLCAQAPTTACCW
jgi:hypothetical protein